MLGSLNSTSHDQEEEDPSATDLQQQQQQPSHSTGFTSNSHSQQAIHMRQLLISCAELVSQSDFPAANRLLSILSSNSSIYGDSTERLVHQFTKALSLRINRLHCPGSLLMMMNINYPIAAATATATAIANYDIDPSLQSCYLSLNQITPFIRFAHLTANQAILEAIQVGQQSIHILDFDIMHGVQWPPLMQALAERSANNLHPPPMIRITGTGHDLNILQRTGDRLFKFAQSLGLRFQFHPLLVLNNDPTSVALNLPSTLTILPDEALAVNCMFYLHRLLKDDSRDLRLFLHNIKAMNPAVVTIAEREANHNHPLFLQRFIEALDYYTAIFDSLEATLPPNSRERLAVEQIWFGREIVDIVAAEGENRRERHESLETWEVILRSSGFSNVPLSSFAHSQAKLLLRLHYPSEGYRLQIHNNSFFLGWQNRALFSVSSWR
ncbi:scarecrow-like protein 18 [Herrania umbratica]|uniref:Scarecrow-like protein 18 n=1 Tax=Herrania umbratica TaxID=108875 RepID=A0A6J1AP37_9ROSI|nr:scarecrow-like protein 18 [Herrania umbratica]